MENENNDLVAVDAVPEAILLAHQARLNITWSGENGDLPDAIDFDAADAQILNWAAEAIQNGGVPGIAGDANANLADYVVDRFGPGNGIEFNRVSVRPKTPFGT